ncbi:MAG TPA: ABC transporter permease, partial [Candidatus Omnitrophota bacterium]|nr:ABC transporter permease [Candidatus Omnitrophota bacterium]
MILKSIHKLFEFLIEIGNALFFLGEVLASILTGRVRWGELLKQIYEQGIQSIVIVGMTSFACGAVLALQGYVMLNRFGTKEYVAHLVVLSLVRELSPVFTSFI